MGWSRSIGWRTSLGCHQKCPRLPYNFGSPIDQIHAAPRRRVWELFRNWNSTWKWNWEPKQTMERVSWSGIGHLDLSHPVDRFQVLRRLEGPLSLDELDETGEVQARCVLSSHVLFGLLFIDIFCTVNSLFILFCFPIWWIIRLGKTYAPTLSSSYAKPFWGWLASKLNWWKTVIISGQGK